MSAVPAMASTFEAFAHSVALTRKGWRSVLASQRMALLHPIPHNVVKMKRACSARVTCCLDPKVQYLFKKKLLTAPRL
jgi:hypothetical protein